ncbi:hypothetical protein BST27_08180, partial [Mycobacterium intermedium]
MTTPAKVYTVEVRAGTLVYFNGHHRSGIIHDVPEHLATRWLRQRFADSIQPQTGRAGAASNTSTVQAAATTALSLGASDELRDTSPTTNDPARQRRTDAHSAAQPAAQQPPRPPWGPP